MNILTEELENNITHSLRNLNAISVASYHESHFVILPKNSGLSTKSAEKINQLIKNAESKFSLPQGLIIYDGPGFWGWKLDAKILINGYKKDPNLRHLEKAINYIETASIKQSLFSTIKQYSKHLIPFGTIALVATTALTLFNPTYRKKLQAGITPDSYNFIFAKLDNEIPVTFEKNSRFHPYASSFTTYEKIPEKSRGFILNLLNNDYAEAGYPFHFKVTEDTNKAAISFSQGKSDSLYGQADYPIFSHNDFSLNKKYALKNYSTIIHESGHSFGLYHPFNNSSYYKENLKDAEHDPASIMSYSHMKGIISNTLMPLDYINLDEHYLIPSKQTGSKAFTLTNGVFNKWSDRYHHDNFDSQKVQNYFCIRSQQDVQLVLNNGDDFFINTKSFNAAQYFAVKGEMNPDFKQYKTAEQYFKNPHQTSYCGRSYFFVDYITDITNIKVAGKTHGNIIGNHAANGNQFDISGNGSVSIQLMNNNNIVNISGKKKTDLYIGEAKNITINGFNNNTKLHFLKSVQLVENIPGRMELSTINALGEPCKIHIKLDKNITPKVAEHVLLKKNMMFNEYKTR